MSEPEINTERIAEELARPELADSEFYRLLAKLKAIRAVK